LLFSPSPIYLTPLIPLSFKGEGEGFGKRDEVPLKLLDIILAPLIFNKFYLVISI